MTICYYARPVEYCNGGMRVQYCDVTICNAYLSCLDEAWRCLAGSHAQPSPQAHAPDQCHWL